MDCPACHSPNIDGARFCAKCGAPLPASAEPEADPLIGTIVGGRYRITGVLGEGGMGRVYTGEQQMGTSVRKVAVKTLLAQFAKDPQTVARFMRECGVVSELEHPNTIKVYDFGQTDSGELYIAMELLNGISLEDELEKGQLLPPERVDKIMGQVCGSLQEAHDKGIVHRDLKPPNIHLTIRAGEPDYVKVLDFGIAKKSEADTKQEQKLTQQGTILGTPPYMSPEQFMGKELDARSDIYSLGVLAYEMLTGRLPFEADTPWQWATQHMTAQPFPFETMPNGNALPPKMRSAVMRALDKDREKRQQTAREFYEEFNIGASRMSVIGVSAVSSMGGVASGTAAIPAPPVEAPAAGASSGRGGATQIGEPLFPDGAPPGGASKTMIEPATPAMSPPAPGAPVMAPPAAREAPKKGNGALFAVIGVVALLGVGGALFAMKGNGDDGDGDDTIPIPTKSDDDGGSDGDESDGSDDSGDDDGSSDDGGDDDGSSDDGGDDDGSSDDGGDDGAGGAGDGAGGGAVAANTATKASTGTSTGTATAPPPPPPASGPNISGCCSSIASKKASAKGNAHKRLGSAYSYCRSQVKPVQEGKASKPLVMAQIKSIAGTSVPGCN